MKNIFSGFPILFVIYSLILISCQQADPNKQVDEGRVKGEIYESKEIGWSIEIPKGWTIRSKDKVEASEQKGFNAIKKSSGLEVDIKALKHLISFQKNQFNLFASTSEPFKEEFPGEYRQNNKALYGIIYKTYADQGIKADTLSGKEIIQGLEFSTFYITIFSPDGKAILHQIMYSTYINGYDFGVNINYNNDNDKATMINAWKRSDFIKKK